jgi:trans-2,3-dihydro-3-hydroxyanthranilate isomerase
MATYEFLQVDAFTDQPLGGNPCAVILDSEDLDETAMLAIAKEMNLSETAFVRTSTIADFGARYFTPAEEIPLAGHPTLAVACALVSAGRIRLTNSRSILKLELQVGPIDVELISPNQVLQKIVMTQKPPQFLATHDPAVVMPIFGLTNSDLLPGYPILTVSTGTPQLMVPVRDLEVLRRIQIQPNDYKEYRAQSDFFSPHLFCLEGVTPKGDTFARHIGVPPDVIEDPFTGSATGGMGAYLWHHGLIAQPKFFAEQGHWMERPGIAEVEVIGPPDQMTAVKVGGQAVPVIRGELSI